MPDISHWWCGIANGAEDILLPELYDYDEQVLINNIINNRKRGKKHHIIINAEGIGHSPVWRVELRRQPEWRHVRRSSDTCSVAEARRAGIAFTHL